MLSYLHAYHAGNHADILKHYVLTYVLEYLNKKEKPYVFFDTHSGSGLYDLLDNKSLKTHESEIGIIKLLNQDNLSLQSNESFISYINLVKKFYNNKLYPGSPLIESHFLRKTDQLIISELHPGEIENLRQNIKNNYPDKNVQIHFRNGWEMLNALTPPKIKRGAVLIDPSYEETQDYIDAAKTIISVNKKWSNAIILLWYPLLAHRQNDIDNMINSIKENVLKNSPNTDIVDLQLCVNTKESHKEMSLQENQLNKNPPRLYGSGMLVINSPWMLKEKSEELIDYLTKLFWKTEK